MLQFRHEWKHILNYADYQILRRRLRAVMKPDQHTDENGEYQIRSLYFDNLEDKALREKLDGVNIREKFRIRYYNNDLSFLQLEKKSKIGGLCNKQSARITKEQAEAILQGDLAWMPDQGQPLLTEFYSKTKSQQLRPKTVVDYIREPFVYGPGNVRVTIDYDIRTGLANTAFLNEQLPTVIAGEPVFILEVKYDDFLPSIIRDMIQMEDRRVTAFSKYAACRIYG